VWCRVLTVSPCTVCVYVWLVVSFTSQYSARLLPRLSTITRSVLSCVSSCLWRCSQPAAAARTHRSRASLNTQRQRCRSVVVQFTYLLDHHHRHIRLFVIWQNACHNKRNVNENVHDRVNLIKPVSYVRLSVRAYVLHKNCLWFHWNLACR